MDPKRWQHTIKAISVASSVTVPNCDPPLYLPVGKPMKNRISRELQTEAYEECLHTYFLTTCFDKNGTSVGCGSEYAIDSFQMPDW